MMKRNLDLVLPIASAAVFFSFVAFHGRSAQADPVIVNDTLTGLASSYPWIPLQGACLTASSLPYSSAPGASQNFIPGCLASGFTYYTSRSSTQVGGQTGVFPDAVGSGALRLTNGDTLQGGNGNFQTGAVVGGASFPMTQGIQVTWTSVSYGGNDYNGTGADGISFFLVDASVPTALVTPGNNIGGSGGSLGYSCSNTNGQADGMVGAYVGVGIDEFGNFGNPGDNTNTGPQDVNPGTTAANFQAGRISLRGAGSTNYAYLASASSPYKRYYPSGGPVGDSSVGAVHNTCRTGYAWNYTGLPIIDSTGAIILNASQTHDKLAYNYPLLAYSDLPSTVQLANQEATSGTSPTTPTRAAAKPITFSLRITSTGLMDFSYSYNGGSAQPVLTGFNIVSSNGPLPASLRFGFSSGTGGGSDVHEITCFKASPGDTSGSSVGTNVESGRVESYSQVYLAFYSAINWWGAVSARDLDVASASSSTAESLTFGSVANWDGGCVLTSGTCAESTKTSIFQGPGSRVILSSNGSTSATTSPGIAFQTGSLTSAQLTALGNSASTPRVAYLRGDRTKEVSNGGTLRNRTSVLGDVIDSSPVWVGPPQSPYSATWSDLLYSSATLSESAYASFATTNATRTNVVYVGANDGLLHGFRAGKFNSDGSFNNATNDGTEVIAFMPSQIVSTIRSASTPSLDYTSPSYSHGFYVDAVPAEGDLYYSGNWHSWIVSGLGAGGQASGPVGVTATSPASNPVADTTTIETGSVFALDVTNPSTFSEGSAGTIVKGDWTSAWFTANGCTGAATSCGDHLGATYGTPAIRRLHDGSWGVLFGNGLNSKSATAGLYIVHISSTGAQSAQYIDTGVGTASNRNGLTTVTPVDLDGDHITDYVYAGDVRGNVWRFDLTSRTASTWAADSAPLFTTATSQPISTRVSVGSVPAAGATGFPKVIVAFGTGEKYPQTLVSPEGYPISQQTLYGIWDPHMAAFDALTGGQKYDYNASAPATVARTSLTTRSITAGPSSGDGSVTSRIVDGTTVLCWAGQPTTTDCTSGGTAYGWSLALPLTAGGGASAPVAEQVIFNPTISDSMFIVNTNAPVVSSALTCLGSSATGYTMAVGLGTGAGNKVPFFQSPATGTFDVTTAYIAGILTNASGTSSMVTTDSGASYLVYEDLAGNPKSLKVGPSGGVGQRLSWTRVR
jgi:type IV pilus assembly protein PilY1